MGILDGLLAQVTGNMDIVNLAAKVGLSPEQVSQGLAALSNAHPEPGDTVETAATTTGLPTDKLQEMVGHIGGEGSLGRFAEMLGAGGASDGIGGMLGGIANMLGGQKS